MNNEADELSKVIRQMQANFNFTELSRVSKRVLETQRQMRESFAPILELQNEIQRSIQPSQELLISMKQIRDIQSSIASMDLSHINNISEQARRITLNINNMIPSSLFQFDTVDEIEEYLDTDKGIDDLQLAYDTISTIDESIIDNNPKIKQSKFISTIKEMTMSERIDKFISLMAVFISIYALFNDGNAEHLENIYNAINQHVTIEQLQYDEQVKHNDEQVRHNGRMEELKEDENDTLQRIANELEISNNLKQKSDAD